MAGSSVLVVMTNPSSYPSFNGTEDDVEVTRTRDQPLAALDGPTLVVHGAADPLVPIATNGHPLIAEIIGGKLLEFEGGEHAAIFSNRDEARVKVTDSLRRDSTRDD